MGERKTKLVRNSPLLYIIQPQISEIDVKMQNYFVVKPNIEEKKQLSSNDKIEETPKQPKLNFKEMSVEEQLEFLTKLPEKVKPIKCQFKTNVKDYKGIIVSQQEDIVEIKTELQKDNIQLKIEEIISISML